MLSLMPAGIVPGAVKATDYAQLLEKAQEANFNLLRVRGGGPANTEAFSDICDGIGLLVWQEFPLACNDYRGTKEYLRVLDQESRSIIRRLGGHASPAVRCGGNELFNAWSRMTDQSRGSSAAGFTAWGLASSCALIAGY